MVNDMERVGDEVRVADIEMVAVPVLLSVGLFVMLAVRVSDGVSYVSNRDTPVSDTLPEGGHTHAAASNTVKSLGILAVLFTWNTTWP